MAGPEAEEKPSRVGRGEIVTRPCEVTGLGGPDTDNAAFTMVMFLVEASSRLKRVDSPASNPPKTTAAP